MDMDGLFESAQSAVDIIRGGTDIVKRLRELTKRSGDAGISAAEINELTLDIQNQLIDAREAQITLLDALRDLKGQMEDVNSHLELQRRYEPYQTGAGSLVLALKAGEEGSEPAHYICPDCAAQGRRSFLQPQGTGICCNPCGTFFAVEPPESRPQTVRRHNRLEGW